MPIKISTPLNEEALLKLKSGDKVLISGIIYTARDAAHKKMTELLALGLPLPFDLKNQLIFYAGPAPAPIGKIIGAIGPTTSSRMDGHTLPLLEQGLKGMLGKGRRSPLICEACQKYKAVYFASLGGAAALLAQRVKKASLFAWEELGAEAIYKLEVKDMPAFVIYDCYGRDFYQEIQERHDTQK